MENMIKILEDINIIDMTLNRNGNDVKNKVNIQKWEEFNKKHPEIERKIFYALCYYKKENRLDQIFCKVCGKLAKYDNGQFKETCGSKECRYVITATSRKNRTDEQKAESREKLKNTNLERYGSVTNLQTEEMKQKRNEKFGGNSPFCSEEIRKQRDDNNARKHRGLRNSFQWQSTKDKIVQYNREHYNVDYYTQTDEQKEKVKKTSLERYGKESFLATEEGITANKKYHQEHKDEINEKAKQSNLQNLGCEWPMQNQEVQQKSIETSMKNWGVPYNVMRKEIMDKSGARSGVNKAWQQLLGLSDDDCEFYLEGYRYDLKVGNVLVEINPVAYHNIDIHPKGEEKKIKPEYHQEKTQTARDNGFSCINVWDWDDKNKIIAMLGKKETLYARDLRISPVQVPSVVDEFLNNYHLQNTCKGQTACWGLYKDDELVMIMTFGKPRYNKNCQMELLRLCTKAGYTIKGGAEKLFKHFLDANRDINSIVSYCDLSKFSGNVYKKLGFELVKQPHYSTHWVNLKDPSKHFTNNLLLQRGADQLLGTSYGKGTNNNEIMLKQGFVRVCDCGQATYIWKNVL